MNLILALVLFNALVLLYQIIAEIFSILYRINGISYEKSKFQVVSVLTGTGFTTNESEMMLLTKKRRRLTQNIMLFSYIFNLTIVTTMVNVFVSSAKTSTSEFLWGIGLTLLNFILIFLINRSNRVKKVLDKCIMKIVNYKRIKKDNFISVYDTYGHKVIAEIEIHKLRESIRDKTIEEAELAQKYDIQLLVVKRGEEIISNISPNTIICENDVIVVFGKLTHIKYLFLKQEEKEIKKEVYSN